MPMTRVLLLGGTGFIGSEVLGALRRTPGVRTRVVVHRRADLRALEDTDVVFGSLPGLDLSWIENFRPDTILHLARLAGRGTLGRQIAARRGESANRRLVAWLVRHAPQTRVVYMSGTLVYGDRGEAEVDEGTSLRPTAFAREYAAAEEPWQEALDKDSLPVLLLRPPWVVGPGSWFAHHYLRPARRQGVVPCYGAGRNWMSFIGVRDCAAGMVHLARQAPPGVYHLVAADQRVRQLEFCGVLGDLLGVGVEHVPPPRGWFGDPAPAEALTSSCRSATRNPGVWEGFQPETPTWPEMLRRTLASEAA